MQSQSVPLKWTVCRAACARVYTPITWLTHLFAADISFITMVAWNWKSRLHFVLISQHFCVHLHEKLITLNYEKTMIIPLNMYPDLIFNCSPHSVCFVLFFSEQFIFSRKCQAVNSWYFFFPLVFKVILRLKILPILWLKMDFMS